VAFIQPVPEDRAFDGPRDVPRQESICPGTISSAIPLRAGRVPCALGSTHKILMSDADQKPTTISDIRNDDSSAAKADLSSLPEVDPAYYTLGKEVGRGGMGRVMEARDLRVGR
jgi:hypothetical protein